MTSPVSILIVDDDDDVRAALYDELSRDYKVESATCGEEAFAALAAHTYDVVISDLKMPDHDGIEVLDFARLQDPGVIRILLTGYADERAHAALLRPDAPFKVGKPWYDEIEVVLRRALEQRQRTNDLTSTLESAIGLGDVDTQLTAVGSLEELGEVVTLRIAQLANVETAWLRCAGAVRVGQPQLAAPGGWQIEQAIDRDGRVRIGAVGAGGLARDMAEHLIQSAQRRAGAIVVSAHAPGLTRSRIDELMRHATIGTLTGSLLHDMASLLQSVDGAVAAVVDAIPPDAAPDLAEAATLHRRHPGLLRPGQARGAQTRRVRLGHHARRLVARRVLLRLAGLGLRRRRHHSVQRLQLLVAGRSDEAVARAAGKWRHHSLHLERVRVARRACLPR